MMGKIAALYNLSLTGALGGAGLVQFALKLTGKAAAQALVEMVPGVGDIAGVAVAAGWTYGAGEGWLHLCEGIATGKVDVKAIDSVFDMLQPFIAAALKQHLR